MLLAPESRSSDWDFIVSGSFGPDVAYINAALAAVFARYDVQQGSIGMEGFSDGASYAIMLGESSTADSDVSCHEHAFTALAYRHAYDNFIDLRVPSAIMQLPCFKLQRRSGRGIIAHDLQSGMLQASHTGF